MSNEITKTKEELVNETAETREEILKKAVDDFMSDKENLKKIFTAADSEEMKKVFRSVGLEVTDEQLEVFKKTFADSMNAEINNLPAEEREKLIEKASESELEKISGGAYENTKKGFGSGIFNGLTLGGSTGLTVALVSATVDIAMALSDEDDGPLHTENIKGDFVWKTLKKSFRRGVGAMAGVGATWAGAETVYNLGKDLSNSSKSPTPTTSNSPHLEQLLNVN